MGLRYRHAYTPLMLGFEPYCFEAKKWNELVAGTSMPIFVASNLADRFELLVAVLYRLDFHANVLDILNYDIQVSPPTHEQEKEAKARIKKWKSVSR